MSSQLLQPPRGSDRELTRDETDQLFSRAREGDRRARERIIEGHVGFAHGLARRYANRGERLEDLEQVAVYALVKAVDRFDITKGVGFRAYASPTILGEIKRHFRDRTWAVHVPRGLNEQALEAERASRELADRVGTEPGTSQLADHLGWSLEQTLEALEAGGAHSALSLDRPHDDEEGDEQTLGDSLGSLEPGYDLIEDRATVASAMSTLSDRDRRILELRFGSDMSQGEIAAEVGLSQMQISRILRRSLQTLREEATRVRP